MKAPMPILIILGVTAMAAAQSPTPTDVAGLKILKVELQHVPVKGPSLRAVAATDPGSQSQAKSNRGQDSNSDSLPALHRMDPNTAEVAPNSSKQDPLGNMSSPTPVIFVASIVVKNIGDKTVKAVHWEYLLFETGAKDPVKRYRVQSKKTILPGEQAELTKEVTPKGHEQQARLIRIEYTDGTYWEQK